MKMIPFLACLITVLGVGNTTRAAEAPSVIPAVQNWEGSGGELALKTEKIFVSDESLRELAELLDSELPGESQIVVGEGQDGFLELKFSAGKAFQKEAYELGIGNRVEVRASDRAGLFYGTRTLLQLMANGPLAKGVIRDAPKYPVRSLLLDVGRKFISVEGLKDWIRMMAWFKFNELHLHLNDNSWGRYPGYRLESKKFPGLASADGHYTFEQIRELQDFAVLRGVTIVPEIDSPGHSLAFTTYRPELAHPEINREGFGLAYLDLRNPDAVKFMEDIWDEVCPLFDSPLVHIGTDEYRLNLIKNKEEREALGEDFRKYINHLNGYIRKKHGKTVRTWSGYEHMPGTTEPDKSVIIDMWETTDAKKKVADGYQVVNSSHFYTYIVPGAPYYGVNNRLIHEKWTPKQFSGKPEGMLSDEDPGLMGGKLHIWNDYGPTGFTWNEIARLSLPSMSAMSGKLWGSPLGPDYAMWEKTTEKLISAMPSVSLHNRAAAPKDGKVWSLDKELILIPNSRHAMEKTLATNLEYPWTASFTLTRHNDVKGNEVLISSDLAEFYLDYQGKADPKQPNQAAPRGVACVRANQAAGYTPDGAYNPDRLIFNYQVPVGQKVTLTLVGEERRTTLYVDGKKIQTINKQMVCPLKQVGTKLPHGVHATIHRASIKSEAPKSIVIGAWSMGEITEKFAPTLLDLPKGIEGEFSVVFDYQGGTHGLEIESVELLENGTVVAEDNHQGFTGGSDKQNSYSLKLKSAAQGKKYQIRATIRGRDGVDSNGKVYLQESLPN